MYMSKRESLTNWLRQYAKGYVTKAEVICLLSNLLLDLEREAGLADRFLDREAEAMSRSLCCEQA